MFALAFADRREEIISRYLKKNRMIRSETFFFFHVTAIESILPSEVYPAAVWKKKQQLLRHTRLHPICKTLHFFKHISSTNPPIKAVSVILLIMQPLVSMAKYVSCEFVRLGEDSMWCGGGSFGGHGCWFHFVSSCPHDCGNFNWIFQHEQAKRLWCTSSVQLNTDAIDTIRRTMMAMLKVVWMMAARDSREMCAIEGNYILSAEIMY